MASERARLRAPPFIDPPGYARHRPEATLLYQLVERHYREFVTAREAAGRPLPASSPCSRRQGDGDIMSAFEGAAPNALLRRGFNRDSLPPGTEIKIRGFQARDRTNRAAGTQVTLVKDGSRLFVGSTGVGTPGDPIVEGGQTE